MTFWQVHKELHDAIVALHQADSRFRRIPQLPTHRKEDLLRRLRMAREALGSIDGHILDLEQDLEARTS